uniref:Uncharacterized protein n=1 Tax=Rhizophora mucronata TaxID=61149 RepID=A0A2P2R096_RHIMU
MLGHPLICRSNKRKEKDTIFLHCLD